MFADAESTRPSEGNNHKEELELVPHSLGEGCFVFVSRGFRSSASMSILVWLLNPEEREYRLYGLSPSDTKKRTRFGKTWITASTGV